MKFKRPEQKAPEEQQKEDEVQLASLLKSGANQRVAKMEGFMPDKSRPKAPGSEFRGQVIMMDVTFRSNPRA